MSPFDLNWTPELENKLSTQIDGQLPDFIAEDHPQFSRFLRSYYEFLEAGELRLEVNIDNILLEFETSTNLLSEDGTLVVTESGSGSTGKFIEGEIITGGTSYATATVLVEDLSDDTPRLFISSQQLFETGETVTGSTSGASGKITRYRANPVQNIQQLLAYADIDNTIYDFIEEFRKSFMEGIPSNTATGIDKRNLEKHIRELYRRKGTKEGAKLFMKILLDEDAEIFYPNQYMLKASAADWDQPTVIRCSASGNVDANELIGKSITGLTSDATALVESATTFAVSGGTSYIEFEISSVVGTFVNEETIFGISSTENIKYNFTVKQFLSSTTISNDGTLYSNNDIIDLDTSVAIGSGDISARINKVETGSVSGVVVDDAGTNYEIGDLVVFTDNSTEAGFVDSAKAEVTVINGNIIDETGGDIIVQESGTNQFIDLFNFQLEEGTIEGEEPYTVYGTDVIYNNGIGYYYPIYLTNYAAEQTTITKSSGLTNGATFNSTTVILDGNSGDEILVGMTVRSNSISLSNTVTVVSVTSQNSITLSAAQTLLDNEVLVFESAATAVRQYQFLEYPGITFYSPTATTAIAQSSYSSSTYTLYGGNYNHRSDHLYGESGNAASYTDGINTEAVLGDRVESEWAVNSKAIDTNRYDNEGFILESGSGDITKITVTQGGDGYSLLPTAAVRSQYGTGAKVLSTTTDIGRISSINVSNPGFDYSESPIMEPRGNFVIKDITGAFVVGAALTSHTGTVRTYDSTTQVLTVSIEDNIAIQDESQGGTSNEGVLLEDSLATNEYVGVNIILDANLVYGENLVSEDGDRLLIDDLATNTGMILLESGDGDLIMEHLEQRLSYFDLEDGTGDSGFIITEDYDFLSSNNETTQLSSAPRQVKFILESSPIPVISDGAGAFIVLDADLSYEDDLVLNGTDASGTNAGEKIIPNATDANGTSDPSNRIVLDQDDNGDGNGILLYEDDVPFDNLILDGTNASSLHATEKVLFEDAGADFSAGTTAITTAAAAATIVHADIAKSNITLGTTTEKSGRFGGIEDLISEALIRIQDSYYYQQFSYEIQTNSGGNAYLNELKKSVHPAGFNVFSKVINTSFVSARLGIGAAGLTETDVDADTFNALLSSTFRRLFGDSIKNRLGTILFDESEILLETSVIQEDGDRFILENETGEGFVELETPENAFPDFEGIEISHGTGAGEFGMLVTEDLDRIVSESAEEISNNIVINGTEDGHLSQSQGDDGSDLLLEDGFAILRETVGTDGISFMFGEDASIKFNIIDETDGEDFVAEGSGNPQGDHELFLRSTVTTYLNAKVTNKNNTGHGRAFLATSSYEGITGDGIQLENGTAELGSRLLITGTAASGGNPQTDNGDHFLLEDSLDVNVGQSVTLNTFTSITNDNLIDETDGDNLILENPVGFQGGGAILGEEDFNLDAHSTSDTVRDSLVNISDENSLDTIVLEGQELGTFKQEDGTTVTSTYGDDILLENYTGFGVGVKLSLEKTFIALEDSLNTGELPFGLYDNTTLAPFSAPSDIFVNKNGNLALEDLDLIVYNTSVDENDQIILEDGTDLDRYIKIINSGIIIETGFSGATTFDSPITWDSLKV